jgi:ribosomal protein L40E
VTGLPAGLTANYYLDGILNGTIATGDTKTLDPSPGIVHTISVDLNLGGGNGTRYQCEDNVWSFSGGGVYTFTYKTQYYLEVDSLYGSPSGNDWYNESTTVQARLVTNITAGPEGVRYVFVKWGQDASGQGTVSDPILMDRPKKAVAQWKTEYNLRMSSDPVGVFSPSTFWFDANSTAEFAAPEGTNGTDARQVFVQWSGDYSGTSVNGSVHMDGPKSVTAKYKPQYRLRVTFDPPEIAQKVTMSNSTWYDAGQTAAFGPVPQIIPESSVQRFSWFSWNVDNMTQPGTSVQIIMDRPHSVRLIYQTQYYLLVTSALGQPTGTGWYVSGQNASFGVAYNGSELLVKHTLTGWRLNSSNVMKTLSSTVSEVTMDRPYVIEAQWNTDYTPLWIFIFGLVSAVMVFAAVVVIIVRRPGSFGRLRSSLRSGLAQRKVAGASITPHASLVHCQKCGAWIPSTADRCHACGATGVRGRASAGSDSEKLDSRVYDYIVKRHGQISLSQASKDFGLSVEEVKLSTERLKNKGRLA